MNDHPTTPGNSSAGWYKRIPPLWLLGTLAVLLVFAAVFIQFWVPWLPRLQLIHEIEALQGRVVWRKRGPEVIREHMGHALYHIASNPSVGPLDLITGVDLNRGNRVARKSGTLSVELVSRLRQFPALQTLDLSYSGATDDWMPQISELKSLERLDLSHCRIAGRGFAKLQELSALKHIDLTYCPIRDQYLQHLQRVPSLRYLGLVYCSHLTADGIDSFHMARPDVSVCLYGLRDVQQELRARGYAVDKTGMLR